MPIVAKKPRRKHKPSLKSVLKEPKSKGPFYDDGPPVLRMGKLDKMFLDFVDQDGHPLEREDILSMCEYLAQSEPPSDDPDKQGTMTRWWNSYLGRHKNPNLRYESICQHAGVSVDEFYGKISRLYHYLNKEGAINRLRGSLPAIVDATVLNAKTPDGVKDRELVLKMNEMAGLQPASTNISLSQNVNMANFQQAGIPQFETEQKKMTDQVLKQVHQRVLGEGSQDYIDSMPLKSEENENVKISTANAKSSTSEASSSSSNSRG